MTCNIIVQARMSSTRFPGKVMQDCGGKPMIGVLMDRLEEAKEVAENLIVVMPESEMENGLADYLLARDDLWKLWFCRRADHNDLAESFNNAMRQFPATSFCRICADSPLIDPIDVRLTIRRHETSRNLLTFGGYPGVGAVEAVDWKLFQRCLPKFTEEDREHVTLYFKRKCGLIVDYPEDFERLEHVLMRYSKASAQECLNALASQL